MDLARISDEALMGKVEALAETERFSLIDFLIHLGELDLRTACQNRGYASVFAYLTRHLGYSESDAVRRIRVARAARKYPSVLRMLASGDLHLVGVAMLEPILTSDNHERLLRQASRRSTREVERLVAGLAPAAVEPRDRIRPLPASCASGAGRPSGDAAPLGMEPSPLPSAGLALPVDLVLAAGPASSCTPAAPVIAAGPVTPCAPASPARDRVVFTFAAGEQVQSWFEEARDLLRHRFPMGRMEDVIGEALRRLVEAERRAFLALPSAKPLRPPSTQHRGPSSPERSGPAPVPAAGSSPESRYVPRRVKDEVWRRDSGRCAYVSADGVRCGETAWLEWDHVVPRAMGGASNDPANIRLLCRAHNQSEARRIFGDAKCSGRKTAADATAVKKGVPVPSSGAPA